MEKTAEIKSLASLGPPIATGRTAELYAWGPGQVIKLVREGFPTYLADQEALGVRTAYQAGLPCPVPGEIVALDGRRGFVLERIEGPTLIQAITRRVFRLARYSRLLGQLHAQVNAVNAPAMPSQKDRKAWQVAHTGQLTEAVKEALYRLIESLPDGDSLCHGDFHPENVILTGRGPVIVDWEPAMRGDPAGDVATTLLWIRSVVHYFKGLPALLIGWAGRVMEKEYLAEYQRLAPGGLSQLEDWIAVKAALRYYEDDRVSSDWLVPLIRRKIPGFGEGIQSPGNPDGRPR